MRVVANVVLLCSVLGVSLLLAAAAPTSAEDVKAEAEKAAHEAAHAAQVVETGDGSAGPSPLAVDPDLAIWTLVVFALLFGFLKVFAWPQIAEAIDERERKIAAEIAAAAEKHEQAKRLLAEHEAKLAATAGEVRALLDEARRDAEHTKSSIVAEARKAAEGEKDRAVREIERAKEGAIHDLAVATANVAIDLAKEVTGKQLSAERNNELVRDAMTKLAASQPSKN